VIVALEIYVAFCFGFGIVSFLIDEKSKDFLVGVIQLSGGILFALLPFFRLKDELDSGIYYWDYIFVPYLNVLLVGGAVAFIYLKLKKY